MISNEENTRVLGQFRAFVLISLVLSCGAFAAGQSQEPATPQSQQPSALSASVTFEDSPSGLQRQFQDFLDIIRSGDQNAVQSFLDSFAIPDAASWFLTHFGSAQAPKLADDYAKAFVEMRSHIWWASGTFAKFRDFSYVAQTSAIPPPVADVGFESLLPRPNSPVSIENFRIGSGAANASPGPPSWVSSFVFLDGRFRWVGGTYPFWAEGLSALRGPMSLAPSFLHGHTVQAIAFRDDQKGPTIDAIVHVEVRVERDGRVSKINFLSGDKEFLDDARTYLQSQRFPKLPDDPRLQNAERKWNMEVAFFTPKQ